MHVLGALADHQRARRRAVELGHPQPVAAPPTRARGATIRSFSDIGRSPHWPVCPRATIQATASSNSAITALRVGRAAAADPHAPSSAAWPSLIVKRPS